MARRAYAVLTSHSSHGKMRATCIHCKKKKAPPSAHNHHGNCSFKRYHKKYCRRHKCGCQE